MDGGAVQDVDYRSSYTGVGAAMSYSHGVKRSVLILNLL